MSHNTLPSRNNEPSALLAVNETWSPRVAIGDLTCLDPEVDDPGYRRYQLDLDLGKFGVEQPVSIYAQLQHSYWDSPVLQPFRPDLSYHIDPRDLTAATREQKLAKYYDTPHPQQEAYILAVSTSWPTMMPKGQVFEDSSGLLRLDPRIAAVLSKLHMKVTYPPTPTGQSDTLTSQIDPHGLTMQPPSVSFNWWHPADVKPLPTSTNTHSGFFVQCSMEDPGYRLAFPPEVIESCSIAFKVDAEALPPDWEDWQ